MILSFQGLGNAEIECFCFSKGLETWFFPISDKKLQFLGSRRLILSKNCDLFAPDGCFCQKIAIFRLLTAVSVKKLRFFGFQRLLQSRNGAVERLYLPIQKCLKMFPRTSLGVMGVPVISASWSRQIRRSSATRSPLSPACMAAMTLCMLSCALFRAS